MKRTLLLNRTEGHDIQKIGDFYVMDEDQCVIFQAKSIERGWLDNVRGESCIPIGNYPVMLDWSPRFKKDLWEIYHVPGRSECKFHSANYARQLNGCVALGQKHIDIDGDGWKDVTSSRKTMQAFHKVMEGATDVTLVVRDITKTDYRWTSL